MNLVSMNTEAVGESSMSMKSMMPITGTSDRATHMKKSTGEDMDMTTDITIKVNLSTK